ncbi:MAG: YHS domain protein [Deltaproteobacteria bacterium]|nr:YHS domain protein [Deltaproteobacteria bacterium]
MRTTIPRWIGAILLAPALLCIVTAIAGAGEKLLAVDSNHIAIKGYDTVAYFTDGKAVKGSSQFEYVYDDARWRFSNAAHREMFMADPERYMPQFGAYCSACLAMNACAAVFPDHPGDPEAWTIVDGKLYMFGAKNKKVIDAWIANFAANIRQASAHWTAIQQRYAAHQ